jgi:hypothetical protein
MSSERLIIGVLFVVILCVAGLISQCSHNISKCREEAIKANMAPEVIPSICRA